MSTTAAGADGGPEPHDPQDVDALIEAVRAGRPGAEDALYTLLYENLKAIARNRLRNIPPHATLQATVLVHETWIRLVDRASSCTGKADFFRIAARAIHDIIVEDARRKAALCHGGGRKREPLEDEHAAPEGLDVLETLALSEALGALREEDERAAELVMLRFFAGRPAADAAHDLGMSEATGRRLFAWARAFLHKRMYGDAA